MRKPGFLALLCLPLLCLRVMAAEHFDEAVAPIVTEATSAPRYHVEVVIFERTDPQLREVEKWPEVPLKEAPGDDWVDFLAPGPCLPDDTEGTTGNERNTVEEEGQAVQSSWLRPVSCPPGTRRARAISETTDSTRDTATNTHAGHAIAEESKDDPAVIPVSSRQLADAVDRLARQPGIKILQHTAWLQDFPPNSTTTHVRLVGGRDWSDEFTPLGLPVQKQDSETEASQAVTPTPTDDETRADEAPGNEDPLVVATEAGQPREELWELDGVMTLYRKRYIHAELALKLREPATREVQLVEIPDSTMDDPLAETTKALNWQLQWEDLSSPGESEHDRSAEVSYLRAYQMKQQRRLRSQELHYFDHPLLGVLLWITPVTHEGEPDPSDEETVSSDSGRGNSEEP
jgi:hypothetical protein